MLNYKISITGKKNVDLAFTKELLQRSIDELKNMDQPVFWNFCKATLRNKTKMEWKDQAVAEQRIHRKKEMQNMNKNQWS